MPEFGALIADLEATRWTGRPGYGVKTLLGACLVKHVFALPPWTRVAALIADHWKLQRALDCEGDPPSHWSLYRFVRKLRASGESIERYVDAVVEGLKAKLPTYGTDLAIDASDMPAYANGQRYVSKDSDGRRSRRPDGRPPPGGRPVVFKGTVGHAGASRAVAGIPVQLQFRYPGAGWSEFRTVEADRRGRFRYAYRFSDDDSRGVRFQFRAYVKGREGWPYGPSASRPVSVRGR